MKSRIWLALLSIYLAWGSTYLAIHFAIETLPPFLMAATRFLIAGLLVYVWRRMAGDSTPTKVQWRSATVIGLFLLLGGNGGVTWAEQHVPSGIAALIVAAMPLWMVVVDALLGGKRPTWQTLAGVFIGLVGMVILVGPSQPGNSQEHIDLVGVVALLLASLSWAIGSIYSRGVDMPKSALLGTGMEMLAGSAGLFLLGTLTGEWGRLDLPTISTRSLLGLAYLIVVGSLVGFVAYSWLLRVAPMPIVATYAYVNPLVAVILGAILAHEVITPRVFVATPIILSAVALIHLARGKPAAPAPGRLAITAAGGKD